MRIDVPGEIPAAEQLGRVHFVGIGGAGLSGIARVMARRGVPVTGSDDNDTPFLAQLRELDVPCHLGYDAAHVGDADTVVVTTAARDDNPEVLEARRRGLTLLPRSAGLKAAMEGQQVLAVAGTHGKTTTTSLLTVALIAAGADPSYAVGGVLTATGRNADLGAGPVFVAEADESDGAFLVYDTFGAIVLNVEADHLDVWGTEAAYAAAFDEFADGVDAAGPIVVGVDDPGGARLADRLRGRGRRVITVGVDGDATLRAVGLEVVDGVTSFDVVPGEDRAGTPALARISLQIPGRHYVMDALAAFALGVELGYDLGRLAEGLGSFVGTGRRMELKGRIGGGAGGASGEVRVYDSYAHHPSEIRGDLEAARSVAGGVGGRLLVCFQPHLVSRTRILGAEMGIALGAADEVVVLDVYVAREEPDPSVTGAVVADAVPLAAEQVTFVSDRGQALAVLLDRVRPGDVVLTLGAGDVTALAPQLVAALQERAGG
ncbi:UDP-N-acetylmuramate--L-alanine ligase [Nocardioides sp. HM23]|uniref:UDP-N-acetylmuramate--L-alanine ligase n=1 Tax=Nocardioides bizhenqiangii TaxID=3095076 RepID=UPI002ACA5DE9|nr:UDP-N-acetylmuramate--L-alanine ligase [Nocardioides sp. HM23]MDZ5620644.1 UDP-N-acetylmuramate--L-alanine ligase [Nocardioides sp. HM23]